MVCHGVARRVLTWPAFPCHAMRFETCPVLPCVHPADAPCRGPGENVEPPTSGRVLFFVEGMGQGLLVRHSSWRPHQALKYIDRCRVACCLLWLALGDS